MVAEVSFNNSACTYCCQIQTHLNKYYQRWVGCSSESMYCCNGCVLFCMLLCASLAWAISDLKSLREKENNKSPPKTLNISR